jgi:hypothetical protein
MNVESAALDQAESFGKPRRSPFSWPGQLLGSYSKAPSLLRILKKRDFETLHRCIQDPTIRTDCWFTETYSMVGENCLHLLLQFRPPAKVVQIMLHEFRRVTGVEVPHLTVDYLGRSPLHVALCFYNSPDVVALLASTECGKTAAMAIDANHRLPLHNAIICYRESLEPSEARKIIKEGLQIEDIQADIVASIVLLLKVFPGAISIRDINRYTPLKYAREVPQANDMVDAMQRIAKRCSFSKSPILLLDILDVWRTTTARIPSDLSLAFEEDNVSEISPSTPLKS